ncbi:MAG: hypothetical protein ACRD0K_26910 [Egibacteraceae bacterium]
MIPMVQDAMLRSLRAIQPLIRRLVEGVLVLGTFAISVKAFLWAMEMVEYADPAHYHLLSAPLAAVLGPLSMLQGYVLKSFIDARNTDIHGNGHAPEQRAVK